MSAIATVAKQNPSPAILMENHGYEQSPTRAMHLWNIPGLSFRRTALTLGSCRTRRWWS
jgi:hypothetical protein